MCLANSFARMESLCLFNFGLRSRIRNISKIRQSNLFEHFLSTLKFLAISHGSFPCCSLTWLPITELNKQSDSIRAKLFAKHIVFFLFFSPPFILYIIFAFPYSYCLYANTCFLLFIPLFQKLYICGIILSMNLNLKMTVERSKRRSYFLSLVFITKCFTKNLLLRIN